MAGEVSAPAAAPASPPPASGGAPTGGADAAAGAAGAAGGAGGWAGLIAQVAGMAFQADAKRHTDSAAATVRACNEANQATNNIAQAYGFDQGGGGSNEARPA